MGKMKANRKFREGDERAVSAVIGVILMVAITVAIAATVYVYVSGMIGGTKNATPNVAVTGNADQKRFVVATADINTRWNAIVVTATAGFTWSAHYANGTSFAASQAALTAAVSTVYINAGDYVSIDTGTGTVSITLKYTPTNSLLGTWTINI